MTSQHKNGSVLGKSVSYPENYDPSLLYRIPRPAKTESVSWFGFDRWVAYELTWIGKEGCPQCCALELLVPASSNFIVESKSLKLYLGSFAQEVFDDSSKILETIHQDLALLLETNELGVNRLEISITKDLQISRAPGLSIDSTHTSCSDYQSPSKELLITHPDSVHEILHSNMFRSLCPVTGQPDYAGVIVEYKGRRLNHDSLLRYLVSFRHHPGFHETCCEKIFEDILSACCPEELTVGCFFTRRGGIEINPVRSNNDLTCSWTRLRFPRQ